MKLRKIAFMIYFAAHLVVFTNISFAESPFGTPKANTNITGLVPFNLAQKIAVSRAHRYWGHSVMGPTYLCADDDGDVVAYMFTFAVGIQSFPSVSDIQSIVQYGRNIVKGGYDTLTDDDKQRINNIIEDQVNNILIAPDTPLVVAPGGPDYVHSKAKKDLEARKLGKRKMIGANEFGTIVVSARFDHFPVPLYTNYLPPFIFQGDLAVTAAAKALSAKNVTLDKIYFLENLRNIYLGFSSNEKTVILNANSLDVEPVKNVLLLKGNKISPVSTTLSEIKEAWASAKKEVE